MAAPALRPMGPAARLRDDAAVIHRQTEAGSFVGSVGGSRDAAADPAAHAAVLDETLAACAADRAMFAALGQATA